MKRYLIDHPDLRADVRASIAARALSEFPYHSLDRTHATRLLRRVLSREGAR